MEQNVREAAEALRVAILEAQGAGYKINWPADATGLATIEISETGAVKTEATEAEEEVVEVAAPPPATKSKAKA